MTLDILDESHCSAAAANNVENGKLGTYLPRALGLSSVSFAMDVPLHIQAFVVAKADILCLRVAEDPPQSAKPVPESAEGRSRIAIFKSGFKMTPISATHTQTSIIFNVDPCMITPPDWLINFILNVMSPWIYGKVVNVLKEIMQNDGAYRQRQNSDEHREFYEHFAERIASYSRDYT